MPRVRRVGDDFAFAVTMTRVTLRLAAFLFGLGVWLPAYAQTGCTVPFILQNGTLADASQVMANFNAILGCVSVTNQASTLSFWVNDTPPVNLNRMNDRLFLGAASNSYNANQSSPVHSWVGTNNSGIFGYLETYAQLSDISTIGEMAGFFASRTSDTKGGNVCCAIPVAVFGDNNETGSQLTQWGVYNTLVRESGAGTTLGYETDIGNLGSLVSINAYSGALTGLTSDLWVACGGELASIMPTPPTLQPCSAAMVILNNGATFDKGIVFLNQALSATLAIKTAIDLPEEYQIVWETPNGPGALIRSDIQDSSVYGTSSILFSQGASSADLQLLLSGVGTFQWMINPGGVGAVINSMLFSAAHGGMSPAISVASTVGGDTNINLALVPLGTGGVYISNGVEIVPGMPTSCSGQVTGTLWNSTGTVHIC